jgi:hypothetical protein
VHGRQAGGIPLEIPLAHTERALRVERRKAKFAVLVPDLPNFTAEIEAFSGVEGTWLWARANPWIAEGLKQRCQMFKANGERMGWVQLTEPERPVERNEAERMTAVGYELTGAVAFWRDRKPDRDYYFLLYDVKTSST